MHYLLLNAICTLAIASTPPNIERAEQTLDALYHSYSAPNTCLLREHYPFDRDFKATYLASEKQTKSHDRFSYLWPYSGVFSAVNALLEATGDKQYQEFLQTKVLPGLEEYFDSRREPVAYSSYLRTAPPSDRFYDDNVWLGIDFTDSYRMTKEKAYLDKAQMIWKFILSGKDEVLGGGIYWCEQKKKSKNTCSNAPGAVLALKLFEVTRDSTYLKQGKDLYQWTKAHLEDPKDHLYFDHIALNKDISRAKYAYNSGQMMQAAALLYRITKSDNYLEDAQKLAQACHKHFFFRFTPPTGDAFQLLKAGNIWFTAVMLRGFTELYRLDHNKAYLADFQRSMDHAWHHARDERGLFQTDWSGKNKDNKKWLLTQAAIVEMYGRIASINQK